MTIRTNPAYAHLAYRKAIIGRVVQFLSDEFLARSSDEAKDVLLCEDVFREDSEIPEETIEEYIEELQMKEQALQFELAKFEFVKRGDDDAVANKAEEAGAKAVVEAQQKEGRKGTRSGKRSGRRRASS